MLIGHDAPNPVRRGKSRPPVPQPRRSGRLSRSAFCLICAVGEHFRLGHLRLPTNPAQMTSPGPSRACDGSGRFQNKCEMKAPSPGARQVMLGELIDLVSGIAMGEQGDKAKDILGRVYEYFLLHYVRNGTVE